MKIKKDAFYSISETADFTKWSVRKLQRYAKSSKLRKIDNRYLFAGYQIEEILLLKSGLNDNVTTTTINDKGEKTTEIQLSVIDILNKEIENLRSEIEYLKEKHEREIKEFKVEIPHQEKLKKAIQLITLEAMEQNVTHKIFSDEEYNDLIGTISEVDFQKEQVNYLRNRVEKQDEVLTKLIAQVEASTKIITQQNFLTARDKGYDN
jgi:hypothetical protein